MHIHWIDTDVPLFWTVDDLLSPEECADLTRMIEESPRHAATINGSRGVVLDTSVRNNSRVIFENDDLLDLLWERMCEHVPEICGGRRAIGLNERFRAYRYEPGQYFAPHLDGAYNRSPDEGSLLTLMVYLNDEFEGGYTNFLDFDEEVEPRQGRGLLFQHRVLHEGAEVLEGIKYVLRTDVMFASDT